MLRFVWRRLRTKRSLRRLMRFYDYILEFGKTGVHNRYVKKLFFNIHILALPTRQHYFTFANMLTPKSLNFSSGMLLKKAGYSIKYFKRSYTSAATLILFFRYYYIQFFKNIYFYWIKNITYRQLYYFKKLMTLLPVNIYYLMHKKSYIPRFFPPRRIKRRVLRLLGHK